MGCASAGTWARWSPPTGKVWSQCQCQCLARRLPVLAGSSQRMTGAQNGSWSWRGAHAWGWWWHSLRWLRQIYCHIQWIHCIAHSGFMQSRPPSSLRWQPQAPTGHRHRLATSHVKGNSLYLLLALLPAGMVCVRFYGEHSTMWVREEDCEAPPEDEGELQRQLKNWGRQRNK